jgi:hypothetical protein
MIMSEAPRINIWANLVKEIDRVSRNGGIFMVQSPENCATILKVRCALYAIYLEFWKDKEIGYPNILSIVKRWSVEATEPVKDPVKYLRNLKLFILSVDLDMLSVEYTMDDKEEAEDNEEIEKCSAN